MNIITSFGSLDALFGLDLVVVKMLPNLKETDFDLSKGKVLFNFKLLFLLELDFTLFSEVLSFFLSLTGAIELERRLLSDIKEATGIKV